MSLKFCGSLLNLSKCR